MGEEEVNGGIAGEWVPQIGRDDSHAGADQAGEEGEFEGWLPQREGGDHREPDDEVAEL